MSNKIVKTLAFKGIERINSGINSNEGACEEILNMRPEGNAWRRVTCREYTNYHFESLPSDCEIYEHSISADKFLIVWDKINNKVIIDQKSGQGYVVSAMMSYTDETIISVSFLARVMTVCTDKNKYFYRYDAETETYIKVEIPIVSIKGYVERGKSYIKTSDGNSCNFYKANGSDVIADDAVLCYDYGADSASGIKFTDTNAKKQVADEVLGMFDSIMKGATSARTDRTGSNVTTKRTKLFKGISFYRFAIRLYDGTYVSFSNPIYLDSNGDTYDKLKGSVYNSFPITMLSDNDKYVRYVFMYNPYGKHHIDLTFDRESIISLMKSEIIESVDLFMTRPVFCVKTTNQSDFYDIDTERIAPVDASDAGSGFTGMHWQTTFRLPRNDEQINDQVTNGVYYRVKKFTIDELNKEENDTINVTIDADDIETLSGQLSLSSSEISHTVLFNSSYLNNHKQHLYNLTYNAFSGWDNYDIYPCNDEWLDDETNHSQQSLSRTDTWSGFKTVIGNLLFGSDIEWNMKIYVSFTTTINNKKIIVNKEVSTLYIRQIMSGSDLGAIYIIPNRFYCYPTLNAYNFRVIMYDTKSKKAFSIYNNTFRKHFDSQNYTPSANINTSDRYAIETEVGKILYDAAIVGSTAYGIVTYATMDSSVSEHLTDDNAGSTFDFENQYILKNSTNYTTQIARLKSITQVSFTNILQLTETDNPFVLPVADNYTFGNESNKIVALGDSYGAVSEEKFGTYPLLVFTSKGIYTMAVGSGNIAYSAIQKLSDVETIGKEVCELGSSVCFVARDYVYIISGRTLKAISLNMKGMTEYLHTQSSEDVVVHNLLSQINNVVDVPYTSLSVANKEFTDEVKDATIFFDDTNDEVNFVMGNYAYVYSVTTNAWYKRTDVYKKIWNTKKLVNKANGYIHNYNESLASHGSSVSTDTDNAMILTKPFMLSDRFYKHIERIVVSLQERNPDWTAIVLLGTNNAIDNDDRSNYSVIKKWSNKDDAETNPRLGELQDVYLARTLRSFKYGVFAVLFGSNGTPKSQPCISGVTLEMHDTRNVSGIK